MWNTYSEFGAHRFSKLNGGLRKPLERWCDDTLMRKHFITSEINVT